MDSLFQCFLHYCVLQPGEAIQAVASAVEGHSTAALISPAVGTSFLSCFKSLRLAAGVDFSARIYVLHAGQWATILPEQLDYAVRKGDKFHFKLCVSGGECFLHYCVLQPGEAIQADASAVEGHSTAALISPAVGTSLLDCLKSLRSAAGVDFSARIYRLRNVGWQVLQPYQLEYAVQVGDRFHFKLCPEEVVDLSGDWAREVLKPFPYSVVELSGLRQALAEPLPLPIPIGHATYATLRPEIAKLFISAKLYPADRISSYSTAFMRSKVVPGMSMEIIWDLVFIHLWCALVDLLGTVLLHVDKVCSVMLWIHNRLCVKFEDKRNTPAEALLDLRKNICELPSRYYGPVQWIIGVALAGTEMAVWGFRRGQRPDELSGYLNMTRQEDKAACLQLSINFLRVALSLSAVCNGLTYLPFTKLVPVTYGSFDQITRRFKINYPRAAKKIHPWSERASRP